jgi:hypothetical protein
MTEIKAMPGIERIPESKVWLKVLPFDSGDRKVTIQVGEYSCKELEDILLQTMGKLMDKYGNDITINIVTNVKAEDRG